MISIKEHNRLLSKQFLLKVIFSHLLVAKPPIRNIKRTCLQYADDKQYLTDKNSNGLNAIHNRAFDTYIGFVPVIGFLRRTKTRVVWGT